MSWTIHLRSASHWNPANSYSVHANVGANYPNRCFLNCPIAISFASYPLKIWTHSFAAIMILEHLLDSFYYNKNTYIRWNFNIIKLAVIDVRLPFRKGWVVLCIGGFLQYFNTAIAVLVNCECRHVAVMTNKKFIFFYCSIMRLFKCIDDCVWSSIPICIFAKPIDARCALLIRFLLTAQRIQGYTRSPAITVEQKPF